MFIKFKIGVLVGQLLVPAQYGLQIDVQHYNTYVIHSDATQHHHVMYITTQHHVTTQHMISHTSRLALQGGGGGGGHPLIMFVVIFPTGPNKMTMEYGHVFQLYQKSYIDFSTK